MKKVLLTIILSMFAFAQANAVTFSIGAAGNQSVFKASATESNHDESGVLRTTASDDGAFDPSYASVFIEVGNETASIGASYSDNFKTPKAINEFNTAGTNNTTEVEAHFENLVTVYGKINLPLGGLYAKILQKRYFDVHNFNFCPKFLTQNNILFTGLKKYFFFQKTLESIQMYFLILKPHCFL